MDFFTRAPTISFDTELLSGGKGRRKAPSPYPNYLCNSPPFSPSASPLIPITSGNIIAGKLFLHDSSELCSIFCKRSKKQANCDRLIGGGSSESAILQYSFKARLEHIQHGDFKECKHL